MPGGLCVGLPVAVLFYDNQRNGLNLFVGSETLVTFITDTAPADGIIICYRDIKQIGPDIILVDICAD